MWEEASCEEGAGRRGRGIGKGSGDECGHNIVYKNDILENMLNFKKRVKKNDIASCG